MRVKIFRGVGMEDIGRMEDRINAYLEALEREGQKVVKVHAAIVPVGEAREGTDAVAVHTIWYEPAS